MAFVQYYQLDAHATDATALVAADEMMDDRAYAYADGFFSTLGVRGGSILWQEGHQWRLRHSAQCFDVKIDVPVIMQALVHLAYQMGDGMIKIIISRYPQSVRGYGYTSSQACVLIKTLQADLYAHTDDKSGFVIQPSSQATCLTERVGLRPARFAGLKLIGCHEQVFAHRQLLAHQAKYPHVQEALVQNVAGEWVSGVMANVFYRLDGAWYTPPIEHSGVAGVARRAVLRRFDIAQRVLHQDDLVRLEGLFFCNAVKGIMPIDRLEWAGGELDFEHGFDELLG